MEMTPETYLIGGCMLSPDALPLATRLVEPSDFADHRHELIFEAMVLLAKEGSAVEPFTVHQRATQMGARGVELTDLYRWLELVGSASSVRHYAEEVRERATRRRLLNAGAKFHQLLTDETTPAADSVSKMLDELQAIRDRSTTTGLTAKTLGEVLDTPDRDEDWVIPRLLERGDRMIVTGHEGLGKTTWLRQMGICMAAGVNPVTLNHMRAPLRVLYVDVENSESQWRRETRGMAHTIARNGLVSPRDTLHLYCGGRMDLRRDRDLGLVHKLVDDYAPDVLFIGPIYKLVPSVNNDEEASPLIAALDTLRDRGLVLIMEAHSPKGSMGERNLAPRGSSALMGWPEFGFGLAPMEGGASVVRWRGDRDRRRIWPEELHMGGSLPWIAGNVHERDAYQVLPHEQHALTEGDTGGDNEGATVHRMPYLD